MGMFDSIWTAYWLRDSPFFTAPLEVEGTPEISLLVGREAEKKRIVNMVRMGGGIRFLVTGRPGVGKTSLVNYIRHQAREERFISPVKEISIPTNLSANQIILETIALVYYEVQSLEVSLPRDLKKKLDMLVPFQDLADFEGDDYWASTGTQMQQLYSELTQELRNAGFQPVILHYNNFDKIKNEEDLLRFLQDLREFFDDSNTIVVLLGTELLEHVISTEDRLRQKFQLPSIRLNKLTLEEVMEVLNRRIQNLRISDDRAPALFENDVVKILYDLHDGNIRDILNSLSFAFRELGDMNLPITVNEAKIRDVLYKGVFEKYLQDFTTNRLEILDHMLNMDRFTATQIAEVTNKPVQNFSQSYIPAFLEAGVIDLVEIKGREKYYAVRPEMRWIRLQRSSEEKKASDQIRTQKMHEFQRTLLDDM